MEGKQKGVGVRLKPELRAKIMDQVGKGRQYPRITDFILAAIEEKLDPLKQDEERDEEFKRKFLRIADDPEVQKYLSKK